MDPYLDIPRCEINSTAAWFQRGVHPALELYWFSSAEQVQNGNWIFFSFNSIILNKHLIYTCFLALYLVCLLQVYSVFVSLLFALYSVVLSTFCCRQVPGHLSRLIKFCSYGILLILRIKSMFLFNPFEISRNELFLCQFWSAELRDL